MQKPFLYKVMHLVLNRAPHLTSTIRGALLFYLTRPLVKLYFTEGRGYFLGPNVRIQRFRCLMAEAPSAKVLIGRDSIIYENARLDAYGSGRIEVGDQCVIGDARISSKNLVRIGSRVITSWNVFIQDFDPHPLEPELRRIQISNIANSFRPRFEGHINRDAELLNWTSSTDPIEIGDDVWLGANVTVLKGARIGAGSIIATGAVVGRGDYPERSIIAGVPAKVVKTL